MPKNKKISQINPTSQKQLGQHLLHNKRLIQKVITLANIQSNETIIDIGAGLGAFTLPLAEKARYVFAVEKDPIFVEKLNRKTEQKKNIKVVQKDFLTFSLPNQPYSVVANIPYSITTPILNKLLHVPSSTFQRAVLVMDKGATKGFMEKSFLKPRLLKWRMWFDFDIGQTIAPNNFSPPPRVDSVIFLIKRKKKPLIPLSHHQRFTDLVSYGLQYRQLPVCEVLKGIFTPPQITHLLRNIQVDRDALIYSLDENQWAKIFLTMIQYVESYRWPKNKK